MNQFRIADFGLRNKGRNYQTWRTQWIRYEQQLGWRSQREAAAIRAMYWVLTALLVGALLVIAVLPARADEYDGGMSRIPHFGMRVDPQLDRVRF